MNEIELRQRLTFLIYLIINLYLGVHYATIILLVEIYT